MSYLGDASPLETYNSLYDRHLVNYFRSARMRRHLIKTGLITRDGEVIPEAEYRELQNRENQKRALLELISHAIVERSLEVERIRQGKIRRTLEEICKLHRVRRMREERRKRAEESILMRLVPRGYGAHEKLDPLPSCPSRSSSLLRDDTIYVPVSDIDDAELAVMDQHSRKEVARLRQIYRNQQIKQHKSGRPPYLYLYDPSMPTLSPRKTNVAPAGLSNSDRTCRRARSKSHGDGRVHSVAPESELPHFLETASRPTDAASPRSKYKYEEAFGDRFNAEEHFQATADWKSVSECHSGNHSSQSDSARILSGSVDSTGSVNSKGQTISETTVPGPSLDHLRRCCLHYVRNSLPRTPFFIAPSSSGSVTSQIPALVFSAQRFPRAVVPSRLEVPEHSFQQRGGVRCQVGAAQVDSSEHPFQEVKTAVHEVICKKTPTTPSIPSIKLLSDDESSEPSNFPGLPPLVNRNDLAKSPCVVKLMYLGVSRHEESQLANKDRNCGEITSHRTLSQHSVDGGHLPKRLITVIQQPCGTSTITVFRGFLQPGDVFEFTSRRSYGHPFSLSLCIDGAQDARISVCCEYRHKLGARIGGKNGHFVYLHVEGSLPCYKCLVAQRMCMIKSADQVPREKGTNTGDATVADIPDKCSTSVLASSQHPPTTDAEIVVGRQYRERTPKVTFSHTCFGTNISRRLTKTTHWECFDSSLTELHCELTKVDTSTSNRGLRYGLEELEDADESHQLSITDDSSALGNSSYNGAPQSTDTEQSKSDKLNQMEDEQGVYEDDLYQVGLEDDCDSGEAGGSVEGDAQDVGSQKPSIFEDEIASAEIESDCSHMASVQERPRTTNRVVIESSLDCRDVVVEKVDAFYQHQMSTACSFDSEGQEKENTVNELNLDHPVQFGRLCGRNCAGDAVESVLQCDIHLTDVAEETPVNECSLDNIFGRLSSFASGDKLLSDSLRCATSCVVNSSPPNVRTRIPSVILETEDECTHSCALNSLSNWPPTPERAHLNGVEVNLNATVTPVALELVTDDFAHASSHLSTFLASSANWSRTTTTRSVAFVSAFNHSRSPTKPFDEMDADLKTSGLHIRLEDDTSPVTAFRANGKSPPCTSPHSTRNRISVHFPSHTLFMRSECHSVDSIPSPTRSIRILFGENQAKLSSHEQCITGPTLKATSGSTESCLPNGIAEERDISSENLIGSGCGAHIRTSLTFPTPNPSSSMDIYETASEATLASPTFHLTCNSDHFRPDSEITFESKALCDP